MRFFAACVLCIGMISACTANDTAVVGSGGRVQRMTGEHASIRMVREWVRMDIYSRYYDVDATFVFRNYGQAVSVTMGFPESGGGDIQRKKYRTTSGFLRFATWVDGKPVNTRRKAAEIDERDGSYETYWVKQVSFDRGQERTVRVQYRSKAGEVSDGERFAGYHFTGGNWKGKVDESTLVISMHTPGTHLIKANPASLKRSPNSFTFRRVNWQADTTVSLNFMSTLAGWLEFGNWREGLAFAEQAKTVKFPGRAAALDWAPPAAVRDGVCFVHLRRLARFINSRAEQTGRSGRASVSWDPETKEVSLQAGGRVLSFLPGRAEMLVSADKKIPLPAAPFVSPPAPGYPAGTLYVPLKPIVDILGLHFRVSPSGHRLYIEPKPQPGAKPATEQPEH